MTPNRRGAKGEPLPGVFPGGGGSCLARSEEELGLVEGWLGFFST